jgi:hypothetical protein
MFQMELAEIKMKRAPVAALNTTNLPPTAASMDSQKAAPGTVVPEYGAVVCRALGLARGCPRNHRSHGSLYMIFACTLTSIMRRSRHT